MTLIGRRGDFSVSKETHVTFSLSANVTSTTLAANTPVQIAGANVGKRHPRRDASVMATDVTTIVDTLRASTPLGRLSRDEALGALNAINALGWTIGGSGSTVLNPFVNTGAIIDPDDYFIGEFQDPFSRALVLQIRNAYPAAVRIGP